MKHALRLLALFDLTLSAHASVQVNYINPVTQIDAFSVRVDGRVTAINETASFVFEYGTTTAYGSVSKATDVPANQYVGTLFTIATGLVPNTQYYMRIKAVGSVTTTPVYSSVITFTTTSAVAVTQTSAPTISHQAVTSKLLAVGVNSLDLDITPDAGSYPFTFQWKQNGKNFGTAVQSGYLHLNPLTLAHGGVWSCYVSNPVPSNATSPSVTVTVADITRFGSGLAAMEGDTISATVTLSPANANATYLWHTSSSSTGLPTNIGTATGQGTNKITIANVNALTQTDLECDVTIGSDTVTLNARTPRIGLKPVIDPMSAQTFRVGEDVSGLSVSVSSDTALKSVTVTGLPGGLKFNSSNYVISGKPTTLTPLDQPAAVVVKATNAVGSSTLAFPITVNPLPADVVGAWSGILDRGGDPLALGGKVTLNVTANGSVTGTVVNGALNFPLNTSVTSTSGSSSVAINVTNALFTKTVNLTLNAGQISGTIGGSSVTGFRNTWNATFPVPITGNFNCKFTPGSGQLSDPQYPHGHSVAVMAVTNVGAVTTTFHLADNTVATASSSMGPNGEVPLFVALYSNRGSVLGTPTIAGRDVSGGISWNKRNASTAVAYKDGFNAHDLTGTGRRYVKPNALLNEYFAGLAAGSPNGHLNLSDGVLAASSSSPVTVTLAGKLTTTLAGAKLTPDLAKGVLSGTLAFTGTDTTTSKTVTRTAAAYALVVPGTGTFGYYLSPVFTPLGAASPSLSGIVELAP